MSQQNKQLNPPLGEDMENTKKVDKDPSLRFIKIEEAAQVLGVSKQFLYQGQNYLKYGGFKIGGRIRFRKDLYEYVLQERAENMAVPIPVPGVPPQSGRVQNKKRGKGSRTKTQARVKISTGEENLYSLLAGNRKKT